MKKEEINYIDMSRIELLWENDHWDVPLEGVLRLDGDKICLFKRKYNPADAEDGLISYEDKEYNRYDIYELSAEEIEHEQTVHNDFVKYVGTNTNFVANRLLTSSERAGNVKPPEEQAKFYSKYSPEVQRKYEDNAYLGSFYM